MLVVVLVIVVVVVAAVDFFARASPRKEFGADQMPRIGDDANDDVDDDDDDDDVDDDGRFCALGPRSDS